MQTKYEEITTMEGKKAISFSVKTRKGDAHGVFCENRIWVHGIYGKGSVKGLMSTLIKHFGTNLVTFTPLINDNVENSIKGEVRVCKAGDPQNPYGEDFKYLDCVWRC